MTKYKVYVGIGLYGCERKLDEFDTEDFKFDDETDDDVIDLMYDAALEAANEHLEITLRKVE